jgi:hypothetical protein
MGGAEALEGISSLRYQAQIHFNAAGGAGMSIDTSGGNAAMDYAQHLETYQGFLRLTKYLIAFLVVLLAGMAYFLV